MRNLFSAFIAITCSALLLLSCAKWKDKAPYTDPNLTNPYCNDPNAVNYNWGFPGKPDNTTCFYPTDIFSGTYVFVDSVYLLPDIIYVSTQTETLHINKIDQTKLSITGFCSGGNVLNFHADKSYVATIDTTVGDTVTARGQLMCRTVDTVNGSITKDRLVDSLLHISFQVISDTGITNHIGNAKKI